MALQMELDYRLRWLDFDRYGHIQPTALLDILQDIATIQAEHMGIGRDDMLAKGVFWAVVRMKYEIVRQPHHNQVVRARTWPHTPTSFSFQRDFSVFDEQGELLVKASSEWVLMDVETRKFHKVRDYYDGPHDFLEDRSFEGRLRKIADFDEDNRPTYTVVPSYSDIDANGHVNNARYLNYVVDALKPGEEGAVRTLQVEYRHEVMPDAPLVMHTRVEQGKATVKGVREDGDCAFICLMELSEQ